MSWPGIVLAGIAVAVAVVLTSNKGNPSDEPKPERMYDLQGTLSAPECGSGYEITNTSVEIRDQNDRLIGATTTSGDVSSVGAIQFEVEFATEVPKANFYSIKIGTHGGPAYSFEEMEQNDWDVDLSLD
jgi:hypothetical protein